MPAVPMSTTPEPNNIAALIAHLTSIIAWGNAFVRPTMLYARKKARVKMKDKATMVSRVNPSQAPAVTAAIVKEEVKATNRMMNDKYRQSTFIMALSNAHPHIAPRIEKYEDTRRSFILSFCRSRLWGTVPDRCNQQIAADRQFYRAQMPSSV